MKKLLLLVFLCGSTCMLYSINPPPGTQLWTLAQKTAQLDPDVMITQNNITPGTYTINTPGTYALAENVTSSAATAIIISASNVTLDLNGHTLTGSGAGSTGIQITASQNVYIRNGFLNNCNIGISSTVSTLANVFIDTLIITPVATTGTGIFIEPGTSSSNVYVNRCLINGGAQGIACTSQCYISSCLCNINATSATGIVAQGDDSSNKASVVENCVVYGTTTNGTGFNITGNVVVRFCQSNFALTGFRTASVLNTCPQLFDCIAQECSGQGFLVNGSASSITTLTRCSAIKGATIGFQISGLVTLISCSSYNNTSDGFRFLIGSTGNALSCISFDNGGNNFNDQNASPTIIFGNCYAALPGTTNYNNILNPSSLFDIKNAAIKSANYWMNAQDV